MKRSVKTLCALILSFTLISVVVMPVNASDYQSKESPNQEIMQESQTLTFTEYGTGKRMKLTVKYTICSEFENSSGKYITDITSLSAKNKYNDWQSIGACTQTEVNYSSNHQVATISFTFRASIGSGYSTYDGSITIYA